MNYCNLSLKKSGEFKVYTLLLEHQICQGQVANAAATILLGITGEGVRTAEICVDRWQETQRRRAKEQSITCVHIKEALHVTKSNNHFLFLLYLTFPQQTTLLLLTTSSFLKFSCPLASVTCHVLSSLLPLWLSTQQSCWFLSC